MNRIKELRTKKGLRQKDMADYLNVAESTFSYWESGKIEINNENLFALSDFFEVSIDYLLGRSDNDSPELVIPEDLKGVSIAFHKGGGEDLSQEEINKVAEYIKFIKSQRKE